MPEETQVVATADPVAPAEGIDLDRAAAEAEQRLVGTPPVVAAPGAPAAEESVVEPVVEAAVPEAAPEEPTDHKERTKLGRKVADLESNIGKLLEQNKLLIERLAMPQPPAPQAEPEPEYVDLSTPEGLRTFMAQERERERVASLADKTTYAVGYTTQVKEWVSKATDAEDADAVEINKLLTGDTPFNIRHSSDPQKDFTYNLSRAEAHYYKQKAKTPLLEKKAPLLNDKPRAPLSVGGEAKADAGGASAKPLKISAAAMEFAKSNGMSDEEVAAVLSAPVPNSFVRGRR
jgi:hypothetical protein